MAAGDNNQGLAEPHKGVRSTLARSTQLLVGWFLRLLSLLPVEIK
jgi:hypothetical protein